MKLGRGFICYAWISRFVPWVRHFTSHERVAIQAGVQTINGQRQPLLSNLPLYHIVDPILTFGDDNSSPKSKSLA